MIRQLSILGLLLALAAPAFAEQAPQGSPQKMTREQAVAQNITKMRNILESEEAAEDQKLRQGGGLGAVNTAPAFVTPPVTGGRVQQELAATLARNDWDFRCHKLKVKNNQGIVNVVCGENLGSVQGNQANQYGTTVNTTR
ncbi:MAG: hypothetical protein CL910_17720 [Deltaproteobacteria bacterium]|jgi:hypothetical protein|nr:hypothetical protein [Deltaproteobacteria bacterium]